MEEHGKILVQEKFQNEPHEFEKVLQVANRLLTVTHLHGYFCIVDAVTRKLLVAVYEVLKNREGFRA